MLFLGNIQPQLQRQVRGSCATARFAALDSMNLWIETERDSLVGGDRRGRLRRSSTTPRSAMLTEEPNLARAARSLMSMGPSVVVAKQGEYGAALFTGSAFFAIPGYPLEDVRDPTGAGDSFAGGFLGYLDSRDWEAGDAADHSVLRQAMAYGSVLASFNVEDFGTERVRGLSELDIGERLREFKGITHFEVESPAPRRSRPLKT